MPVIEGEDFYVDCEPLEQCPDLYVHVHPTFLPSLLSTESSEQSFSLGSPWRTAARLLTWSPSVPGAAKAPHPLTLDVAQLFPLSFFFF